MEGSFKSHNLFQVFLRLRPAQAGVTSDRFLDVEPPVTDAPSPSPTHIRLNPPNDRRRAIEKFGFTRVFEEDASQLDVFHSTGVVPLVEGVLAPRGAEGTDALVATLGVTGSGKSHTILGSRSQRGLTQLALDVVFRSIGDNLLDCSSSAVEASIQASDASEATVYSAHTFIDSVYGDMSGPSRASSRAATPMLVRSPPSSPLHLPPPPVSVTPEKSKSMGRASSLSGLQLPGQFPASPSSPRSPSGQRRRQRQETSEALAAAAPSLLVTPLGAEMPEQKLVKEREQAHEQEHGWQEQQRQSGRSTDVSKTPRTPFRSRNNEHHYENHGHRRHHLQLQLPRCLSTAATASVNRRRKTSTMNHLTKLGPFKGEQPHYPSLATPRRGLLARPTALPQLPDVSSTFVDSDHDADYAVLLSMYEVYNDRIFDLLTPAVKSATTKEYRRRPLLFKSTESSPDRKIVAGLRKIACSSLAQALLVLEAGLHERRVAGTGSNSVSSRSHGFVCIEVKKRTRGRSHSSSHRKGNWSGNVLTVVDLAGSERARDAKTAGATLAEAGKINESLMYLGQCLQMQSDLGNSGKPNVVPFRQCKLTELLFSNSFPSATMPQSVRRNPQKAVMIVTADPHGDFNATSQILRYSALAREITVPRIPTITQTILATSQQQQQLHQMAGQNPRSASPTTLLSSSPPQSHAVMQHHRQRPFFPPASGSHGSRTFSPQSNASSDDRITMEIAALEIARMSEEMDYLRAQLQLEAEKRMEAEAQLVTAEERLLDVEQDVREECAAEFEERLALEMGRWKASLDLEKEHNEEHWDRKVEVMERLNMAAAAEDAAADCSTVVDVEDKENVLVENLEQENERLRRELLVMRRELTGRSPTKRKPLHERDDLPLAGSTATTPAGTPRETTPVGTPRGGGGTPKGAARGSAMGALTSRTAAAAAAGNGGGVRGSERPGDEIWRKMKQLRVAEKDYNSSNDRHSGASMRSNKSTAGSPKKMRKLSPRKWDVTLDDEDDMF